jgi:hypothetical protein
VLKQGRGDFGFPFHPRVYYYTASEFNPMFLVTKLHYFTTYSIDICINENKYVNIIQPTHEGWKRIAILTTRSAWHAGGDVVVYITQSFRGRCSLAVFQRVARPAPQGGNGLRATASRSSSRSGYVSIPVPPR